jgi:hypothetical protein
MVARLEEASARAYEQFEHELARVEKRLANPAHDSAHNSPDDSEGGNPPRDTTGTASGNTAGRLPPASTLKPVIFPRERAMAATKPNSAGSDMDDSLTRMTTFRPASVNNVQVPGDRPSHGRRYVVSIGLVLVACIVAGVAWQKFYGGRELTAQPSAPAVEAVAAKAAQPAALARTAAEDAASTTGALPPPEAVRPNPPAVQADAPKAAAAQPAPPAQTAPEGAAPTATALPPDLARLLQSADAKATPPQPAPLAPAAPTSAALPPELAQLLQTMARDLATVEQGIEQLKTSQDQMARDNARLAEQLKASQDQMADVIARASEHNLPPRTAPRPRPITAPTR